MYNRYIPQPDGSYYRDRRPEQGNRPSSGPSPAPPVSRDCPPARSGPLGIGDFLKRLVPGGFDTEDLLIVLLCLLMAREKEDNGTALLTLALYLFL